ncbi:MAG: DUF2232 domain-containing protein [Candidatus Ozemobacteraceae bacterium]
MRKSRNIQPIFAVTVLSSRITDPAIIVRELFRNFIDEVAILIPWTFVFLWHLLSTTVFYLGGVYLGARNGFSLPPLPRFSTWRFDWNLIWIFIAGWSLYYGEEYFAGMRFASTAHAIGANCLAVSKILYFVLGLSLMVSFFERHHLSRASRIGLCDLESRRCSRRSEGLTV